MGSGKPGIETLPADASDGKAPCCQSTSVARLLAVEDHRSVRSPRPEPPTFESPSDRAGRLTGVLVGQMLRALTFCLFMGCILQSRTDLPSGRIFCFFSATRFMRTTSTGESLRRAGKFQEGGGCRRWTRRMHYCGAIPTNILLTQDHRDFIALCLRTTH